MFAALSRLWRSWSSFWCSEGSSLETKKLGTLTSGTTGVLNVESCVDPSWNVGGCCCCCCCCSEDWGMLPAGLRKVWSDGLNLVSVLLGIKDGLLASTVVNKSRFGGAKLASVDSDNLAGANRSFLDDEGSLWIVNMSQTTTREERERCKWKKKKRDGGPPEKCRTWNFFPYKKTHFHARLCTSRYINTPGKLVVWTIFCILDM